MTALYSSALTHWLDHTLAREHRQTVPQTSKQIDSQLIDSIWLEHADEIFINGIRWLLLYESWMPNNNNKNAMLIDCMTIGGVGSNNPCASFGRGEVRWLAIFVFDTFQHVRSAWRHRCVICDNCLTAPLTLNKFEASNFESLLD